jgi:hypothetical protein
MNSLCAPPTLVLLHWTAEQSVTVSYCTGLRGSKGHSFTPAWPKDLLAWRGPKFISIYVTRIAPEPDFLLFHPDLFTKFSDYRIVNTYFF